MICKNWYGGNQNKYVFSPEVVTQAYCHPAHADAFLEGLGLDCDQVIGWWDNNFRTRAEFLEHYRTTCNLGERWDHLSSCE